MSYLIAAYLVTIVTLIGYALHLRKERNSLLERRKSNTG
jgi:CcmD family protein